MAKFTRPKHGNTYRIRPDGFVEGFFYVDGLRRYRSLGRLADLEVGPNGRKRSDKQLDQVLQRLWDEKLDEIRNQKQYREASTLLIGELFQDWMDASAADKAPGTRAYYLRSINEYLASVGNHAIGLFRLSHVDRYKAHLAGKNLSVASINIRLQNLKTFLRWAVEREYLEKMPRIPLLRRERKLPRVLSEQEVLVWLRLLQRIRRHKKGQPQIALPNGKLLHPNRLQRRSALLRETLILTLYETGCRFGEAFHLELNQFDLDAGLLRIQFKARFAIKERREKVIPLTPRLKRRIKALRRLRPEQRYLLDDGQGNLAYASQDSLAANLKRDMATLGYAGRGVKVVHGFRALFAHRLRERGAPLEAIKNLLGHSDIKVTEGYFPASQTRERAAVALLDVG